MTVHCLFFDSAGESGGVRERRLVKCFEDHGQARDALRELSDQGLGSYHFVRSFIDEEVARCYEIKPRSGNDQMWDRMEEAWDRADFERETS